MNYGSIGSIIGHELTHCIDSMGLKSSSHTHEHDGHVHTHDVQLTNNKWRWTDEATEEFQTRAQCMVEQYGEVRDEQIDELLDGKQTLMENIADNGGLKEAYAAFQLNLKRNTEDSNQVLPGLNFTAEQLFFVSHAKVSVVHLTNC